MEWNVIENVMLQALFCFYCVGLLSLFKSVFKPELAFLEKCLRHICDGL